MKIFLDIGSHVGQTLDEVTKPTWDFDEIHAIEPMPKQFEELTATFGEDSRVKLHRFALLDHTGEVPMYGTNDILEASVYPDKVDVDSTFVQTVPCVSASEFFADLPDGRVWVNMNCEGAELRILDDLLWSGEIKRIYRLLVSFDIRKIPGLEVHEERLREALRHAGVDVTSEYPERKTHQEQIEAWLRNHK